MMFLKCSKFGRKAELIKSEYFTKNKKIKIKNFGRADPPCECQKRGVGCNLPYIPINHRKSAFYLRQKGRFRAKTAKMRLFRFCFCFL